MRLAWTKSAELFGTNLRARRLAVYSCPRHRSVERLFIGLARAEFRANVRAVGSQIARMPGEIEGGPRMRPTH